MLRDKARTFKNHTAVSLESLVPQNHFYRQLEARLDLSFIRELVAGLYSTMGRPSIDPVVFFKLQLIMFFEGIRSERQLMEQVQVNLAHRWYIGYDLDEAVPDHSSLSKIRDRYGLEVFQRFFEAIVERCCEAGLVWGKELYFDGTQVRANADPDQQVPRFYWQAGQHMPTLFGSTRTEGEIDPRPRGLVHRYNGQWIVSKRTHSSPIRQSDLRVCPTDPDASPLYGQNGHNRLGYHLHYGVDGGISVRGAPEHLRSDNGPEFIAYARQQWLQDRHCPTLYIRPGSPWENPFIESFNGTFRSDCLNRWVFTSGQEAQQVIEDGRLEYNQRRPHSSLGYRTPAAFAQQARFSLAVVWSMGTDHWYTVLEAYWLCLVVRFLINFASFNHTNTIR